MSRTLWRSAAAFALALLVASPGAGAAEVDPDYATGVYVLAIGLSHACPAWEVDPGAAATLLDLAGIAPDDFNVGGKYHQTFMTAAASVKPNLAKQSQEASCREAERMFGPRGVIFKRLLGQDAGR